MDTQPGIEELEKELALAKDALQTVECGIAELKGSGQELEEGQWAINNETLEYLFKYPAGNHATGFFTGDWGKWGVRGKKKLARPATDDEIKEALVAEAKRRGLVAGKTIITPRSGVKTTPNDKIYKYYRKMDDMEDVLTLNGWLIYYEGNWAEPVEDTVTINGVGCEVLSGQIKLDCGNFISHERYSHFFALVDEYDLTVMRKGEDITQQIKKLGEQI